MWFVRISFSITRLMMLCNIQTSARNMIPKKRSSWFYFEYVENIWNIASKAQNWYGDCADSMMITSYPGILSPNSESYFPKDSTRLGYVSRLGIRDSHNYSLASWVSNLHSAMGWGRGTWGRILTPKCIVRVLAIRPVLPMQGTNTNLVVLSSISRCYTKPCSTWPLH